MCVFTLQETFVLSSICQKCQHTRIKAFLCIEVKWGWKREGDCDHKTACIWVPWHFMHILDKTKVFYLVKTHILSFMTRPIFARYLRDTISISFKMRKKGMGHKRLNVFFLTNEKLLFSQGYAKNVRVPSNPPPPYIKLWRRLTSFTVCHILRIISILITKILILSCRTISMILTKILSFSYLKNNFHMRSKDALDVTYKEHI